MPKFYTIFARKIIEIPEFLRHLTEKLTKFPHFTRFWPEKMPEFYIIIARKIYFPILFLGEGGTCPLLPSPTPMELELLLF